MMIILLLRIANNKESACIYKKDCYLRRNFFDDYKKLLEKLAFTTASLFHRQLLI